MNGHPGTARSTAPFPALLLRRARSPWRKPGRCGLALLAHRAPWCASIGAAIVRLRGTIRAI